METCITPRCGRAALYHAPAPLCRACYGWSRVHQWALPILPPQARQQAVYARLRVRVTDRPVCEVYGCQRPAIAKGLCNPCHKWWRRHSVRPALPPGSRRWMSVPDLPVDTPEPEIVVTFTTPAPAVCEYCKAPCRTLTICNRKREAARQAAERARRSSAA